MNEKFRAGATVGPWESLYKAGKSEPWGKEWQFCQTLRREAL